MAKIYQKALNPGIEMNTFDFISQVGSLGDKKLHMIALATLGTSKLTTPEYYQMLLDGAKEKNMLNICSRIMLGVGLQLVNNHYDPSNWYKNSIKFARDNKLIVKQCLLMDFRVVYWYNQGQW